MQSRAFRVVISLSPSGANWGEGGRLPRWLPALHRTHGSAFRFVIADPDRTGAFMQKAGLRTSDAPTAVIHDTATNTFFRAEPPLRKASDAIPCPNLPLHCVCADDPY